MIDKIISELEKCVENVNNQYMNNRICTEEAIDRKACYETAIDIVKKYSSLEPKNNGWIPCSERLPVDLENYLVTLEDEYGELHISIVEYGKYTWTNKPPYSDVIAWQPLPQPYKGE